MESRKIVKSGNTSFILSLPIKWVRSNNLDSGKVVQVSENEQGDLVLSAGKVVTGPRDEFVTIKVDGKSYELLNRELLAAYVRDPSSIIFEGQEILQKTSRIIDMVRFYIGLDIMEQSTNTIVVKNFFSLDLETSSHTLLKKMDIVNRASLDLLKHFFKKGFAQEDFFELQKLDEQIARLEVLIRKSTLKIFEHPNLMRTLQTTFLQVSKEKISVHALRSISSSSVALGKLFLFLAPKRASSGNLDALFREVRGDYRDVMGAVYNKSYDQLETFLMFNPDQKVEPLLKTEDDPLMIQVLYLFGSIWHNLRIIAEEALL